MTRKFCTLLLTALLLVSVASAAPAEEKNWEDGKVYVNVHRRWGAWENPMQAEFIINGETVDIFTTDTYSNIDSYLKKGWNEITVKTTPQEPANDNNYLEFSIGPIHTNPKNSREFFISPVLWAFDNGTDWKFQKDSGTFLHPLGPDTKEISLTYHVYYGPMDYDMLNLEKGDYILDVKRRWGAWNSPVSATIVINGTPLPTFVGAHRKLVITPLLKKGKNEVKLISHRVKDAIDGNDLECFIGGPATWSIEDKEYQFKPVTEFKAMQGWKRDKATGQLVNIQDPKAEIIERTILFMIKEPLGGHAPKEEPKKMDTPEKEQPPEKDKYRSAQVHNPAAEQVVAASL